MNWKMLAMGSLLAVGVLGCKENNPPATSTAPVPVVPAVPVATEPATTAAPTMPAVPTATEPATEPAMSMPAASMPAMSMPDATVPAATVPTAATEAAATLASKADGLLATATQAIKDKKWDIADGAVTQLENLKPSLPTAYGPKIDQVKTLLNGAKALTQPGALPFKLNG
jgi:hypothetical protein